VLALALVARDLLGRQLGLVRRHGEVLRGVLLVDDRDPAHFAPAAAVVHLDLQLGAGFRAQGHAGDRGPFAALAPHHQALAVEVGRGRRLGGAQAHACDAAGYGGGRLRRRQGGERNYERGEDYCGAQLHAP
jgi:hypothetical protein